MPASSVDAPDLDLDQDMAVIISEEKDQGAAWQVTYRGLVATGRSDLAALEQNSPLWLLDFVLGNRVMPRDPVKIVRKSAQCLMVDADLPLVAVFCDSALGRRRSSIAA